MSSVYEPNLLQMQGISDYWTNDGVIEGVWIFSRHGDRTPTKPLMANRDAEAAFWMTKLPMPDSAAAFTSFSKYYPVLQENRASKPSNEDSDTFVDVARNPFGFLTSRGLQQLSERGQRFFNRYNKHAHHLPDCKDWETAQDFLSVWNVDVYSTNYLRTIMSAQSFLDGMFHTQCYTPGLEERAFDANVIKEEKIPCPSSTTTRSETGGRGPLVSVKVRDLQNDPLNAFDRNPELISDLISEVIESADFVARDGKAAQLAARLANFLPGLVKKSKKATDFSTRAPSGINWVEASDHFVCRNAHSVPLARFGDLEDDDNIEQTLEAMSHPTLAHLAWRFRKWYQHDRLLAVIAAPPLREITNQILATPMLEVHERRPFSVYSCHDITILGLLYGIGADFLAIEPQGDNSSSRMADICGNERASWRYWPPYGSNLVFELVRVKEGPPSPSSHVVRVLLNGAPVKSLKVDHPTSSKVLPPGGPEGMLFINDFAEVVNKLERAGGHDYDGLLGRR